MEQEDPRDPIDEGTDDAVTRQLWRAELDLGQASSPGNLEDGV